MRWLIASTQRDGLDIFTNNDLRGAAPGLGQLDELRGLAVDGQQAQKRGNGHASAVAPDRRWAVIGIPACTALGIYYRPSRKKTPDRCWPKYPRGSARQGAGDWSPSQTKICERSELRFPSRRRREGAQIQTPFGAFCESVPAGTIRQTSERPARAFSLKSEAMKGAYIHRDDVNAL